MKESISNSIPEYHMSFCFNVAGYKKLFVRVYNVNSSRMELLRVLTDRSITADLASQRATQIQMPEIQWNMGVISHKIQRSVE